MKRLQFEQRFYFFLIMVAIFGLVGDRAWEWQKGAMLDDVFAPESFELFVPDQTRTIASDPSSDISPQTAVPTLQAVSPGDGAPPGGPPIDTVNAEAINAPAVNPEVVNPANNVPLNGASSPNTAPNVAVTPKALPADNVVLAEAADKFHRWRVAQESKDKKRWPPHSEMVTEINKLLTMVNATAQPLMKSEAYRYTSGIEFLLAREVWFGKKIMLRRRAYGHLHESMKAFPGNFLTQWELGLAILQIAHMNPTKRSGAESCLGITVDDELKSAITALAPFGDNLNAQFMLESLLEAKDARKQLSKEEAQTLSVTKQKVKNFRAQPDRASEVKFADAALEKFRNK